MPLSEQDTAKLNEIVNALPGAYQKIKAADTEVKREEARGEMMALVKQIGEIQPQAEEPQAQ